MPFQPPPPGLQRYEPLLASIDGIVWQSDARRERFAFVSGAAERLLGHAAEAWRAPGFWAGHIHPDDRDWVLARFRGAEAARSQELEYRLLDAEGRAVRVREVVSVAEDADAPARLCGVVTIAPRRRSEDGGAAEGDDLYRFLTASASDLISLFDLEGNRVFASPSFRRVLGRMPPAAFQGIHPDDQARSHDAWRRILAGETTFLTLRHAHADGSWRWLETRGSLVRHQGRVQVAAVSRDVTDQRRREEEHHAHLRAEGELRASEARFRAFVDHATDAFFLHDEHGTILDVNQQACESLGYTREELVGATPAVFDLADGDASFRRFRARLRAGEPFAFDTRHVRRDGTVFSVEVRVRPFIEQGRRLAVALVHDITERKRAQESLTLFRSLLDNTNEIIEVVDPVTARVLDVNQHACTVHGYTREEYLRLTVQDLDPLIALRPWPEVRQQLERAGSMVLDSRHRRRDGSEFPVEISVTYIRLDRDYLLAVVRDVTERTRVERALIESHGLLNAVVEGTSDVVFVKDLSGRYLMINSAGARFLHRRVEEVIGRDDRDLFPPETADAIMERDRQVMASGESQTLEEIVTFAGVTRAYLATRGVLRDARGTVTGLVGISSDVTELKRLEEQFRQAQKMEAVGRLAGGVAHDFNNLLTVINSYSEEIVLTLAADDPARELMTEVRNAGERAANLTRQLLAFSRKQVLVPRTVNLNALLGDLLELLNRLIGEDVELALLTAPELGPAKVDTGQFEQAIVNLAVNARDAMPQGGRLTIETADVELDREYAETRPDVRPGPYVLVSVSDTGHGMDEETRARIFEPFFTTKEPGKGTGLGLAMVYGFVKQSGGHVEAHSEPGRGTAFSIYLPRAAEGTTAAGAPAGRTRGPRGTETLLLVEDEDAVRRLARRVLESNGYTVLEARDGEEAVRIAREHPEAIHGLVTDLVMPRMSGPRVAELVAQARPGLRILFMSGYTEDTVLRQGMLESGLGFLQKPFGPAELAHKVREVLDAPEPPAPYA